jgi:hypothetical protein
LPLLPADSTGETVVSATASGRTEGSGIVSLISRANTVVTTGLCPAAIHAPRPSYRLHTGGADAPFEIGGMDFLFDGLVIPELRSRILAAVAQLSEREREQVVERHPCPEFKDAAIALYAKSGGYRTAESRARELVLPLCDQLTAADIDLLTTAIAENDEIYDANGSPGLVLELFKRTQRLHVATRECWERLLRCLHSRGKTYFTKLEEAMVVAGMAVPY